MKRILCFFSILSLILASCSSNVESAVNAENVLLPMTEKYTNASYPEDSSTVTYAYDGNKITSLTYDNGSAVVFTYTGNLITKAVYTETYEGTTHTSTTTFTYENDKLKSTLKVNSGNSLHKKRTYTYNADGTISTITLLINPQTLEETEDSSSILTLDVNGNIIKQGSDGFTTVVEYDTKNSPFKSILGYSSLLDSDVFDQDVNSSNNLTKVTDISGDGSQDINTYVNTYNSDNYLTKSVNGSETKEYTY
ncbi:DUF2207 domain-containing protein [Flavobacterium sp. B183]|uniref:DUF2207 domain-containing protein n=1 Tax=Flavobacterium sp. B183 TaxID=907046 RepID=UPI00201EC9F4|nr:DUF2207 domain-containing protein [Flavobacterium sp. B183]URC14658.1 DUF2207 domain-containing protein [Flavobacterium sp. B183]